MTTSEELKLLNLDNRQRYEPKSHTEIAKNQEKQPGLITISSRDAPKAYAPIRGRRQR